MVSVITGDVIESKKVSTEIWLKSLKGTLSAFGENPGDWEIYRGDSFQLLIKDPLEVLHAAIQLKAVIKEIKGLDVRMAIGIGEMQYKAERITESNGTAFVYSGEKFELLKKEKLTMAFKTPWKGFDEEINLYVRLGLIIMDNWTSNAAEAVVLSMNHPEASQEELGKMLGIKQNAISRRLKRAYFEEVVAVMQMYRNKLKYLI